MADFHAPNMAYSPKVTANRITTQRELSRARNVHRHKLTKIARRRREYKAHEPKHRHLRQNLKREQMRSGTLCSLPCNDGLRRVLEGACLPGPGVVGGIRA